MWESAQGHLDAAGSLALCRAHQLCQVGGRRPALGRGAAAAAQGMEALIPVVAPPIEPLQTKPPGVPQTIKRTPSVAHVRVVGGLWHVALPWTAAQRVFACRIAMDCCSTIFLHVALPWAAARKLTRPCLAPASVSPSMLFTLMPSSLSADPSRSSAAALNSLTAFREDRRSGPTVWSSSLACTP